MKQKSAVSGCRKSPQETDPNARSMLSGYNIVYFGPGRWDGLWRNRQQLMSIFARKNRVLFVEGRLSLRPTLGMLWRRELKASDLFRSPIRQISKNLFVLRYPIWAPWTNRFCLNRLTRRIRWLCLQYALGKLKMSQPITWFSRPTMVDLVNEVPSACLRLYHVVDEYSAYVSLTPASSHYIRDLEKQMMAPVDLVIVCSQKLYEAKRKFNDHTFLVPNGVNYGAYAAALADPYRPDDLRRIKPPRLGYIGLIGDKLDFNLLLGLAKEHPEWSLVFLGNEQVSQQRKAWQELRDLANVHYLGRVEVSQVPHYVKGFQVGLLPYVQNRHAEHICPLKLYDYLAAGIPIASVEIPVAREFSQYVHLSDSPQNFAEAVRTALADVASERRQARREIAAQHNWETRVEQLSDLIRTQLARKGFDYGDRSTAICEGSESGSDRLR